MNRTDFLTMINDPGRIDSQIIGEIKELIDYFPYFQTAHLLLLKGLHNSSDVKFAGQLLSSSVHIADREVLYYLLNTISDTGSVAEKKTVTEETNLEIQTEDEKIKHVRTKESLTEEIEKRLLEIKETVPDNMNIVQSAVVEEEHEALITGDLIFELESGGLPVTDDLLLTDYTITNSFSLTDLLNFEYDTDESVIPPDQPSDTSFKNEKINQAELIDKFIMTNPRIEPVKDKSTLSILDILSHDQDDKGNFVSETLAKIYINQEYYSKAIDIYEKLSLKFPEKSSYFATQIEIVKELIKQK